MKNDKILNIFFDDDFENTIQETNENGGKNIKLYLLSWYVDIHG